MACTPVHEYDFSNAKRGTAIIINNMNFAPETYQDVRTGAKHDSDNLEDTLELLGFKVKSFSDLTSTEMISVLQNEAETDHAGEDCFVCAISTHGDQDVVRQNHWASKAEVHDVVYATDGILYINLITKMFTARKCPSLAGKPKLFFIQACRGEDLAVTARAGGEGEGGESYDTVDWGGHTFVANEIPLYKDYLLAYSAPPGYYSFRRGTGSWFITALCDKLQTCHKTSDLMTMLTQVNQQVAMGFESNTPRNQRTHQRHIIPWIASMLTKNVVFRPKTAESERLTFV